MNKKSIPIVGGVAVFTIGLFMASSVFSEVLGETSQMPSAPKYSEICAHGHNGFDCKSSQYRIDISELQEKTSDLEKRVSQLENR